MDSPWQPGHVRAEAQAAGAQAARLWCQGGVGSMPEIPRKGSEAGASLWHECTRDVASIMFSCVHSTLGSVRHPMGQQKNRQKNRMLNGLPACHLGPKGLFARGSYVWDHLAN